MMMMMKHILALVRPKAKQNQPDDKLTVRAAVVYRCVCINSRTVHSWLDTSQLLLRWTTLIFLPRQPETHKCSTNAGINSSLAETFFFLSLFFFLHLSFRLMTNVWARTFAPSMHLLFSLLVSFEILMDVSSRGERCKLDILNLQIENSMYLLN